MKVLAGLAVGLIALGVAAHLTRPTKADFEAMVSDALRLRIANTEIERSDDFGNALVLAGCKLRTSDCVHLLLATIQIEIDRGFLTTSLQYEGLKRRGHCIGAFRRFWCRGGEIG